MFKTEQGHKKKNKVQQEFLEEIKKKIVFKTKKGQQHVKKIIVGQDRFKGS